VGSGAGTALQMPRPHSADNQKIISFITFHFHKISFADIELLVPVVLKKNLRKALKNQSVEKSMLYVWSALNDN
jgi:hypothetical protein